MNKTSKKQTPFEAFRALLPGAWKWDHGRTYPIFFNGQGNLP